MKTNDELWMDRHPALATTIFVIVVLAVLMLLASANDGAGDSASRNPLNQQEYDDPAYGPGGGGT